MASTAAWCRDVTDDIRCRIEIVSLNRRPRLSDRETYVPAEIRHFEYTDHAFCSSQELTLVDKRSGGCGWDRAHSPPLQKNESMTFDDEYWRP